MPEKVVTINARKFDNRVHRSWRCAFVERTESLLTFVGEFDREVIHPNLGVIRPKTVSYEFYWLDRWYSIFRFHEPGGALRNFYCNVNLPPVFENGVLDYVDLDIDVLVWKDYRYEILDLEEFKSNAEKYEYPRDVIYNAEKSLAALVRMIGERVFPFDYLEQKL